MKANILITHILIIGLFSCNYKEDNCKEYIISKNKPIYECSKFFYPGPTTFYSDYNFILGINGKVFFHNRHRNYNCITGMYTTDSDFARPTFIDLKPSDLIVLDVKNLNTFLIDNIKFKMRTRKDSSKMGLTRIIISSLSDTLNSMEFKTIKNFIEAHDSLLSYGIRMITEEEKMVLECKLKNKYYYRNDVKWKTNFLEPKEFWDNCNN